MITRIVRLHFNAEAAGLFLELFSKHKTAMTSVKGCQGLSLFQDADEGTSFATISQWQNAECLEAYRQSALFLTIWKKITPHFAKKAEAFTLNAIS